MPLIEVVIDGTNFGGKTPLVAKLLDKICDSGLRAETMAPYREREVYALWDVDPVAAAKTITDIMRQPRVVANDVTDVLVWDRGWPTCYVATKNAAARALFEPLPRLTFLLLNTDKTTERKVRKYGLAEATYPWMSRRHRLRDEISYEQLAEEMPQAVRCLRPTLEDSRFDLDLVASEIVTAIVGETR